MNTSSVALQLYTIRDATANNFVETVHKVAEMGYAAVEFAGYGGLSAAEMKKLLSETGLRAAGTHVGLALVEENPEEQINYCVEIGCQYLIVPWLPEQYRNPEAFKGLASRFNAIGKQCQEKGITFAYHNHDFEFKQYDGRYLLDYLLEATDPQLVKVELDTYWVAFAGADPIAYLKAHAGRIPLIHVKDMTEERTFTEVGDGVLDEKGIYQAALESGTQWFVVENDAPVINSLESARRSLENLKKM